MKLLGTYNNGNYTVQIYDNGTKIRSTKDDEFIPQFAENMDVKITDKCSQNCPFCYEGCTKEGKHAHLMNGNLPVQKWLEDLQPYTELAINGNDMDHPELLSFLEYLKTKKVITNITVNQNQFINNYDLLYKLHQQQLIYGIGVSLINPNKKFIELVKTIPTTVIHTIYGVLNQLQIESLSGKNLKILILGYKNLQRGVNYFNDKSNEIQQNINFLKDNLKEITNNFQVVSFDNLGLEQLNVKEILFSDCPEKWETFYMGDDGTMTYYIDAVNETYSKNSCMPQEFRYSSKELSSYEMFQKIKNQ
jgi:hypothetical protein